MMRVLCGTDIVHIQRIEKAVDRQGERFLGRLFTSRELVQCKNDSTRFAGQQLYRMPSLAARFAGKEAIAKALGTGVGPFNISWTDLEILSEPSGLPVAVLHAAARERYVALGGISIAISLAHEQDIAQAFCVILCSGDSSAKDAVSSISGSSISGSSISGSSIEGSSFEGRR